MGKIREDDRITGESEILIRKLGEVIRRYFRIQLH